LCASTARNWWAPSSKPAILRVFYSGTNSVPLEAVENALTLAAARRMARPTNALPLGIIRSLAYFSPVIEEVLQLKVGQEYFQHLRHRLQRAASAR
jgi:hypothetical protein